MVWCHFRQYVWIWVDCIDQRVERDLKLVYFLKVVCSKTQTIHSFCPFRMVPQFNSTCIYWLFLEGGIYITGLMPERLTFWKILINKVTTYQIIWCISNWYNYVAEVTCSCIFPAFVTCYVCTCVYVLWLFMMFT